MRHLYRSACLTLLLSVGTSITFGWGNATHVYLTKHLGVKFGPMNLNEMYGSVLPDMFNLVFTPEADALAEAFHFNTDLMYGFYGTASSRAAKSGFYGFFTHNNVWGVDYTAHDNGVTTGDIGWVIEEAITLEPAITPYLIDVLTAAGADLPTATAIAAQLAPAMAHDLVELGVDVLVKQQLDPLVGARLYFGAKYRSPEIPQVLAGVLSSQGVPPQDVLDGEAQYREGMMQYGSLFMLPTHQLIPAIGQASADLAETYIAVNTGLVTDVSPARVAEFLVLAMNQVRPRYKNELFGTFLQVKNELVAHGVFPAGPVFAFGGSGTIEEELGSLESTDESVETPVSFSLEQNYPNPFNPSTTIAYALPADGHVRLSVFNAIGQEIATLVDEVKPAGVHTALFEANGLPSGAYFYRLQAGSFVETRRMNLVK